MLLNKQGRQSSAAAKIGGFLNMIKYFILILCYVFLLLAISEGLPKHLDLIEADSAFNECLQDLTYKECKTSIYN